MGSTDSPSSPQAPRSRRSRGAPAGRRVDQPVDGQDLRSGIVALLGHRGRRRLRDGPPLGKPPMLSDARTPALEHRRRGSPVLAEPGGCGPGRQQLLDQPGKTGPAQVVAQSVRVKVARLAVPAKNRLLQRIQLRLGEFQRRELLLDLVQQLGMDQDRPEQLAGSGELGLGDRVGEPARARRPAGRPAPSGRPLAAPARLVRRRTRRAAAVKNSCRNSRRSCWSAIVCGELAAALRERQPALRRVQRSCGRRARAATGTRSAAPPPRAPRRAPRGRAARSRLSGSWPGGSSAKRSDLPGLSSGSARSIRRWAARRPASSPSRQTTGSSASCQSSASWASVTAVPSGATALAKPAWRERDHVHVAFGDDHRAALAHRRPRQRQAVEQLALAEQRRLGGVQVLRARLAQRPAAEAHDPAAPVVDREHHAVAEAVEARRAVLGLDQQAGLEQRRLGVALGLQRALERGARRRARSRARSAGWSPGRARAAPDRRAASAPWALSSRPANQRAAAALAA